MVTIDLETELRSFGDAVRRSASAISLDEIRANRPGTLVVPVQAADGSRGRRRRRLTVAAGLAIAATLVLAVLLLGREREPERADGPVSVVGPEPNGALVLDGHADWVPASAGIDAPGGPRQVWRFRWYGSLPHPECCASLTVVSFGTDAGTPAVDGGDPSAARPVFPELVDGYSGGRVTTRIIDGFWVVVTGRGLTDDEIRAAASTATLDADPLQAAHLDPAALPASIQGEIAEGTCSDSHGCLPQSAFDRSRVQAEWRRGSNFFRYEVVDESAATAAVNRLDGGGVEAVEVGGHPAALLTPFGSSGFHRMTIERDGRTVVLASDARVEEFLDLAASLRPATQQDWDSLVTAARPKPATLDPRTGRAEPGTRVPPGVTRFPALADGLVPYPELPTWAYYTFAEDDAVTAGAAPVVHIHGIVRLSVQPGSALAAHAGHSGPLAPVTVAGYPGWLFSDGDRYIAVAVDLGDGTSLVGEMTPQGTDGDRGMTRDEFLDVLEHVELVGEREWEDRYEPMPPIVPLLDNPPPDEPVTTGGGN